MRSARWLCLTVVFCVLGITSPSWAQEQIKPYFVLIFDTSGSMNTDPDGAGPQPTRLVQAKNAVNNIVNSTGDAVFGLMRFRQVGCDPQELWDCTCSGAGSPCGTRNDGDLLVGIFEDNQNTILPWVDTTCDPFPEPINYELLATGNTPLGGSLDEAESYWESGILNVWGDEYLGDRDAVLEANEEWESPIVTDMAAAPPVDRCRPYANIVLTDGNETCGGNAPAEAANMLINTDVGGDTNHVVRTYAIGFGVPVDDADIEAIACNGGTDNPEDGQAAGCADTEGFYATDEAELAYALSVIIEDSMLIEVCNQVDDDCDTFIDEGVTNACDDRVDLTDPTIPAWCGPLVEVCNGVDDDCDAVIDEGFTLYCDRQDCDGVGGVHLAQDLCANPGECVCDGIDDNCNGIIDEGGICGGCVPSPEICDNLDNDCDGAIDEGLNRVCGTDVGECTVGIQECRAGVWGWDEGAGFVPGECSGIDPVPEICNNLDDDCNGVIDGQVRPCGSDEGECQSGAQRCTAGAWGACVGEIGPIAEICDSLDNDCDGVIDDGNPGGGAPCGSDEGECVEGTYECIGGALVCDDVGPSPEVCDNLDNDCDGLVDEGNPGGGGDCGLTDEGECELGVEQCLGGEIVCIGEVGPSPEVCDDRDNDCDGAIDEGNPGGGGPCGTDEGECEPGTLECVDGDLVCQDEVGPSEEICDGLDNDCDGEIDEGIPIGAPCGSDVGECEPGNITCVDGVEDCVGGIGPSEEICDGLDNDCDGAVDEGACEPGSLECVDGEILCVGGRGPADETCDCDDEDCDGEVDEDPGICPAGSACIDCSCRSPCDPNVEFNCPEGLRCTCEDLNADGVCCEPRDVRGCGDPEYFCLGDRCADVECAEPSECDPSSGACVDPCEGVACEDGLRCDSDRDGLCFPNDCYNFPEDCAADEACIDGLCQPHPCDGVDCGADAYCSDGDCIGFCDDVRCDEGQRCRDGACEPDPCFGSDCARDSYCNPETGICEPDLCRDMECTENHVCDHATGECVDDPCLVTVCPEGYECADGLCSRDDGGGDSDADTDVDVDTDADTDVDQADRGLATGAGGCQCGAAGESGRAREAGAGVLLLGLALVIRRRAR